MKIGTLTKGNKLWQISFRNERKFRAHHDHEELKRFQHLDSAYSRVNRFYSIFNHCEYICALIPIRFENPGVRIRYEREPSAYLCVCHAGKELDFVALVSPAEAARKVRWFNRLKRDFSSEVA